MIRDKATPTTRKTVTLPNDMWEEVTSYRKIKRFGSDVEALRQLLRFALQEVSVEVSRASGRRVS